MHDARRKDRADEAGRPDVREGPADIEKYFLGSILSGGDSDPKDGNSREAWIIPGAVVFPHNIGLGATRDAALVEQIGKITAEEVRAIGVQ